jgi:hypothetical protein
LSLPVRAQQLIVLTPEDPRRSSVARGEGDVMSQPSPEYDAYLDDPDDDTTGFGYGLDPDADTPASAAPDPEPEG